MTLIEKEYVEKGINDGLEWIRGEVEKKYGVDHLKILSTMEFLYLYSGWVLGTVRGVSDRRIKQYKLAKEVMKDER